jgi:hypothetical protein
MCAARGARAMMLELSWYEGLGLQARRCFVVSYLAGSLGSVRAIVRLLVNFGTNESLDCFSGSLTTHITLSCPRNRKSGDWRSENPQRHLGFVQNTAYRVPRTAYRVLRTAYRSLEGFATDFGTNECVFLSCISDHTHHIVMSSESEIRWKEYVWTARGRLDFFQARAFTFVSSTCST